ncbi:unnamed protein product [Trifolium pratense]|uniref:Uncharacterized protein n=1 Tax=Trifolium pratense TaxID=57577 RepID=A0ACB0I7H9_TRIPR|nr:unnamed protein product [Trifolium pratense]
MPTTNAERLDDLTVKVDSIIEQLAALTSQASSSSPPLPPPPPLSPHPLFALPPRMKLDVPKFDGTDAMGWIFKISQLFDYHNTPENDRLTVTSFYMEGRFFLLISEDEIDADKLQPSPSIDPPTIDPPQIATEPSDGQISFHALSGCTDPATIRIAGNFWLWGIIRCRIIYNSL